VLVGDCAAPRTVLEAIREGRAAARGDLRGVLERAPRARTIDNEVE
jgi:hypothetical protein